MTSSGPQPPAQPGGESPEQPGVQPQPGGESPPPQVPAGAVPQGWAWARPPHEERVVETEPLDYHRLLRGVQNYRWWKPLLLLVLAAVYFGVFTVIVSIAFVPVMLVFDPEYATDLTTGATEILDTQRPVSVLVSLVSIIIMIPSVLLAMLTLGMRPVGRVWSVAARIRWGLLWRLFGVAVLAVVVMNVVGIAIALVWAGITDPESLTEVAESNARDFNVTAALISLLLVVLLVPFQAVAEELVFRGLFMQVIGAWLKNPWFAILIPSVGFAFAHIYDVWGLLAVGLLGVAAAWLTWRTGGLEAAMAIHVANNLIVFALMTSGFGGETAQTSDGGSFAGVIGEAAGLALFVWLTLRIFARGGHGRSRIDLVRVQVQVVPVAPPPGPPYAPPAGGPEGQRPEDGRDG